MKRVHVTVHGQVQGVGFRYHTFVMAEQLGITGWVRNRYDGTVEIEGEGPDLVVDRFIDIVKEGPRFSKVSRLEKEFYDTVKGYRGFTIEETE